MKGLIFFVTQSLQNIVGILLRCLIFNKLLLAPYGYKCNTNVISKNYFLFGIEYDKRT